MTPNTDHSRAPSDALNIPLDQIQWANDPRPKTGLPTFPGFEHAHPQLLPYEPLTRTDRRALRRAKRRRDKRIRLTRAAALLGVGMVVAAAVPAAGGIELGSPGRQMPEGCRGVVIQKGGPWVSTIAGANGLDLGTIARLNPQIPNLSKVFVGDEIAVTCDPNGVALAPAQSLERNEVQRATDALAKHRGTTETCKRADGSTYQCWTWEAIVIALHDQDARGEQLVTLAAITPGESGRAIDPCTGPQSCDRTIAGDVWGESGGAFQIRSLRAETGKGTTRDLERVRTLEGGAKSAVELWNQSVARGKPGGQPWTCFLRGWHESYLAPVRAVVAELGLS